MTVALATMFGGVKSMLMPLNEAGVELPARSVQAVFTVWFAPGLPTVMLWLLGDPLDGVQVKVTTTG